MIAMNLLSPYPHFNVVITASATAQSASDVKNRSPHANMAFGVGIDANIEMGGRGLRTHGIRCEGLMPTLKWGSGGGELMALGVGEHSTTQYNAARQIAAQQQTF